MGFKKSSKAPPLYRQQIQFEFSSHNLYCIWEAYYCPLKKSFHCFKVLNVHCFLNQVSFCKSIFHLVRASRGLSQLGQNGKTILKSQNSWPHSRIMKQPTTIEFGYLNLPPITTSQLLFQIQYTRKKKYLHLHCGFLVVFAHYHHCHQHPKQKTESLTPFLLLLQLLHYN